LFYSEQQNRGNWEFVEFVLYEISEGSLSYRENWTEGSLWKSWTWKLWPPRPNQLGKCSVSFFNDILNTLYIQYTFLADHNGRRGERNEHASRGPHLGSQYIDCYCILSEAQIGSRHYHKRCSHSTHTARQLLLKLGGRRQILVW